MTAEKKIIEIMKLLAGFSGNPEKLQPIGRQIDILGSIINSDSPAYRELVLAKATVLDPDRIDATLEHLAKAERLLN